MIDTSRVIELYASAGGDFGTGYLLADTLILTAKHVVRASDRCEARPLGRDDWCQARVVWRGDSCDAALLELETPASPTGPTRFGRVMAGTAAPCEGVGFPAAQRRQAVRDTEDIKGRLRPMAGLKSGLLTIDIAGSVPTSGSGSPWAGASGAALFSGPLLIGVVHLDPANYEPNRLMAVPVSSIAAEPGFGEVVGDVRLEAVEEALTDALRPRMAAILDSHPVFGGRETELARLDAFLRQNEASYLFVAARSGLGKTALLAHWLKSLMQRADGPSVAYTFINRGRDGFAEEDFTLRNLSQQLGWLRGEFEPLPASTAEVRARYAKLLVERPYGQEVVIVLDGLDEARGWMPGSDLFPHDLPAGTHIVFSAREYAGRDVDDWIEQLGLAGAAVERLTLAPLHSADVGNLLESAERIPDWARRPEALRAMVEISAGDPFYLRFLVEDVQSGTIASVEDLRARPTGLDDFFAEWWRQAGESVLAKPVRDLLGYLLVALGPMSAAELAQISDDDELDAFTLDAALTDVHRFVVGDADEGYALSHPRFQAYLAGVGGPLHGAAGAYRERVRQWAAKWREHRSRYALTYVLAHLAEAAREAGGPARDALADELAALVSDHEFHSTHVDVVQDLPRLHRDLELALDAIAQADATALVPVVRAATGLEDFRRGWLRPEGVFQLARSGRLGEAERRLALFGAEDRWQQVARLVILWIGAELSAHGDLPELGDLKARVTAEPVEWGPLPMLLQRVQCVLGERPQEPELRLPYPPFDLPAAPPPFIAEEIVARIGGRTGPEAQISGLEPVTETSAQHGDAAPVFVAETDAPVLVAFAAAQPVPGDDLLDRYIRVHASNPYAEYRNRSLWGILGATACHPSAPQSRALAGTLAEAALAPPPIAFREGMRPTVEAIKAAAGDDAALQGFESHATQATSAADALGPQGDSWANHARRLALLAEAEALALGRADRAATLLQRARLLPFGFAGFRTSACLTLAEAHLVCSGGDVLAGVPDVEAAQRAAHNIQEPSFCALRTARVNAMLARWWQAPIADPPAVIARFVADPLAAEFAPVHVVGETYGQRNVGPNMIPIADAMRQARTLREIAASVYQVPLTALQGLQPATDPDTPLAPGTHVPVPERGFAPILAARLSAGALVSPALAQSERTAWIRRLVPIAADNPTAMHTVLTRLLLAERPVAAGALEAVGTVAPWEWMHEPSAGDAIEFGVY